MNLLTSFKREFGLIIVGAIIFIASFLWKDFIKEVEEQYFPRSYGLAGRAIYTIVITVILVIIAIFIKNIFGIGTRGAEFDDSPIDRDSDDDIGGDLGGDLGMGDFASVGNSGE